MCGLFAAFCLNGPLGDVERFEQATQRVSHRGPDSTGTFSDETCFLGHTRLAILGLEASSNQPFTFDGLTLIFNGEIFNYLELRDELVGHGYRFTTGSDTEVVVKAFHYWGVDCFSRFNGMWALAIYNSRERSLLVCRDRFGQKPLFTCAQGEHVLLASEFHQLASFCSRQVNYSAIATFLREGPFDTGGQTFFQGIEEFPKAHYSIITTGTAPRIVRYWNYWEGPVSAATEDDFNEFEHLLNDAVRVRLRTDVPYSIMLSGGVDSTIIGALARKHEGKNKSIKAFTYSAHDHFDESEYALEIARELNFEITTRSQSQCPEEYISRLSNLVFHMGRGHSSPAIVSLDCLQEAVHDCGVKIAIDGQGSDELLAGYPTYFPTLALELVSKLEVRQLG
ncbi:MAG: asparagine synthase (glutamine-hydrolyzing), partial [Bdellovibrionales bacterium]|nr:asparagine synthase (glutamine-hydrolyzing) [Bdellovibrionales bacterium]